MGDLCGGAFLGAVIGELLKPVVEVKNKVVLFKERLEKLESTLRDVTPTVQEIQKLNQVLDRPQYETEELIDRLKEGQQLVSKCSQLKRFSWKKGHYSEKIDKLNTSIVTFFQTVVQLQQTKDNREILVGLKEMGTIVRRLSGNENIGSMFNVVDIGACSVPDPPKETLGLDVPLKELKMELFKNGMQVIVISAPGGYGKSTMVKKLCMDNEVQGKFKHNIFFVTFSKTPNVKVIVQKIFRHNGFPVPEFQTDEDAINDLERLLKKIGSESILLVLDDVWSGSKSLLKKFEFQLPNYKILVTSRFIFPQYGSGYKLKGLDVEAAMTLFLSSAKEPDGPLYTRDENLVKQILKACKRSPLALTVVGGSLCGKPAAIWQRTVEKLAQGVSIFESNTEMHNCLESSLDALNNEAKECYMDLCSFPEDQRIPINALIDMWMELYESAEDGVFAIDKLLELSNGNLVNLVVTRKDASDDGCYNDHFVMQHDLLRDLTICLSQSEPIEQRKRLIIEISGNNFPSWLKKQKQHPNNARLLSITTDETFSSTWYDMQVPKVEVVVLNIRTKKYALPDFLEKMDKLKVLIITNYGFFPSELINVPILGSLCNLKRIRLEHVSVPSFGMIMAHMKNLQRISLVMCNVYQAFQNSNQILDAFPNLLEIEIDYCNDLVELPDMVCDIVSLKKLRITNCHKLSALPEGIDKLVNLEVLILTSCTDLSALPDTIGNLSTLYQLDISECLNIKELPEQIGELCSLETLCMKWCSCKLPASIENLKNLKVVKCDEETACQWERFRRCNKNLKIEELQEDINLNWLQNPLF